MYRCPKCDEIFFEENEKEYKHHIKKCKIESKFNRFDLLQGMIAMLLRLQGLNWDEGVDLMISKVSMNGKKLTRNKDGLVIWKFF